VIADQDVVSKERRDNVGNASHVQFNSPNNFCLEF